MSGLLANKTALITGGSRGIGKAMVERFVAAGANVAFTYHHSQTEAEQLIQELSSKHKQHLVCYQSDAASLSAAEALIAKVGKDFGTIDILVNNAGITRDTLLLRMQEAQWDAVINTNLKSVFNLTKSIMRPMLKQRAGSIINISSVVGLTGNAGQANYAASKAGIIGFSKSIAREVGSRNIRCNVIAPGFINTDMTDQLSEKIKQQFLERIALKRLGEAKEVADTAIFLASDLSTYITGQVISVCGGY